MTFTQHSHFGQSECPVSSVAHDLAADLDQLPQQHRQLLLFLWHYTSPFLENRPCFLIIIYVVQAHGYPGLRRRLLLFRLAQLQQIPRTWTWAESISPNAFTDSGIGRPSSASL